ncbi:MAG: alpha-galactosidase [Anaerolineales bacterium]
MHKLIFDTFEVPTEAESFAPVQGGYLLQGAAIKLRLKAAPRALYRHGWQSWSLAAWTEPRELPIQQPVIHHAMQTDPVYTRHPAPHSSGLMALDFGEGKILLLGALGLESHLQWRQNTLQGWYESGPDSTWFVAFGSEKQVFSGYAQFLAQRFGTGRVKNPYRVWCSWYSLYTAIDEKILGRIFNALGDLPFDVLQVDDGWQLSVGDWEANKKFPAGMAALAEKIHATGRKAGLWLAPLIAVPSSRLFREHPDWFLKNEAGEYAPAGFNWGEPLRALDTTHPAALEWLAGLMKQVRAWGYDYVKLDFLYAGGLPGKRHGGLPREAAYRQGLSVLREALGEAYLLTCGAPILASLGLCDGMRVSTDVSGEWENFRDAMLWQNPTTGGARNALRSTLNRLWLAPLVHPDPDVAYFRSAESKLSPQQNQLLQDMAQICRFKATSDLPQWLTPSERDALRRFLEETPQVEQTGRNTFRLDGRPVDFSPAAGLPPAPGALTRLQALLFNLYSNQPFAMRQAFFRWQKSLAAMRAKLG